MKLLRLLMALLMALPAGPAPAQTRLPDLGESAQSELTPVMERRVGEQIMRQIRRDPDYLSDPEVAGYIQSVGQRLVAASSDTQQEFEFFVVRDPSVNAFALPGGYVGVHSGLITTAASEAELASVLAHEISHVTQRHLARQFEKQNQLGTLSLIALLLALVAARSNPGAAQAAIVGAQAAPVQAFLSFSRDFEREADRVGFQLLQQSGYDVYAMPTFFERLQQASRNYDGNAPVYLRSHPLTAERIADMRNRAEQTPVRQRPDSTEFQLVRAKLRAEQGRPDEAVAAFRDILREKRFTDEAAAHYGYAVALTRAKDLATAESELKVLRKKRPIIPMYESLAARVRAESGDINGASAILEQALRERPDYFGLRYAYAEVLQLQGRHENALVILERLVREQPRDARLYNLQAKSYAAVGNRFQQHRALAETYYLQGSLPAAIEQLQFAQTSGQGDFYTLSAVDARVRELRREHAEELAEARNQRKGL
jgi:predicted Zn-dependent protease